MDSNSNPRTQRVEQSSYDGAEIARKLKIGSPAIDGMEREINSVVRTVLCLVERKHEIELWHREFSKRFQIETLWSPDFPSCKWYFVRNDNSPHPGKAYFEAECCLNIGFGEVRFKREHGEFNISHYHVQQVYESLPLFVDGMRKLLPFLEDSWQPFLDAADFAEKNGW